MEFFQNYPDWAVALLSLYPILKAITILTPTTSDDKALNIVLMILNKCVGNIGNDKNADDK